jgi:hypothetical protein
MKTKCPECGNNRLGDVWVKGRHLQQHCYECDWKGPIRIPEKKGIETTIKINVGRFGGFQYTVFDRYGYPKTFSRSYATKIEAEEDLNKEVVHGKTDQDAGPYTGILWPDKVEVKGEVFK